MADTQFTDISGEGSGQLNGGAGVSVTGMNIDLVTFTSPRVRELYTDEPHRLMFAGTLILAYTSGGTGRIYVTGDVPINWDNFDFGPPVSIYADTVYWKLPNTVQIGTLTVFW